MRILYHHRTQAEDAQGIHIQAMIDAFRASGHHVDVMGLVSSQPSSSRGVPSRWKQAISNGPVWLYELASLSYNIVGYLNLASIIRRQAPQLIYERYSLNTYCGIWASRRFKIPHILEVNAPLYLEQKNLGKLAFKSLARFSERWICSHTTRTVTVSGVMKNLLVQEGVPERAISVIPNGIDPGMFRTGLSGDPIREKYGLQGKTVIGFVGWFRPWHGLEQLVTFIKEAHVKYPDIHLLLVGDGPAAAALQSLVHKLDIADRVSITGPMPRLEIPGCIAAMDIAVQPSVTDYACPMKIIEYMAMAKCIVAPSQPNITELLNAGKDAILFTPNSQADFYAALYGALADPALRAALGRAAASAIEQRQLTWNQNAVRVLSLLSTP